MYNMDVQVLVILLSGIVGLMVGSFSNVCVYRIPRGESVAFPGSHCPNCNHDIAWYDNIPLLSWLMLRAKCRHCQMPISGRYPFLETLMGVSWALLAWKFGATPMLLEAIVLVSFLWILSLIDYETGYLPDILTLPGIVLGVGFAWWIGDIKASIMGAMVGYGAFWLVAKLFFLATKKEGMGAGDFKLLAMLGAFMGWQALPFIVFVSSLVGAVVGFAYLTLSKQGKNTEIPFGPYLAMAGVLWFLWGHEILLRYQTLFFS